MIVREQVENNIKKQLADFIDKQAMANCIGMEQSTKRYYPYGSLASSVIGFTGADDQGLSVWSRTTMICSPVRRDG